MKILNHNIMVGTGTVGTIRNSRDVMIGIMSDNKCDITDLFMHKEEALLLAKTILSHLELSDEEKEEIIKLEYK